MSSPRDALSTMRDGIMPRMGDSPRFGLAHGSHAFPDVRSKENLMKSLRAVAVLLVALVAVPLFAESATLVDDVIRMYKSGVPEDAIIHFVQRSDARFDVNADDLIALSDAKVPRTIIKAVLDEADVR